MIQTQENDGKPHFRPDLGLLDPNLGCKKFFWQKTQFFGSILVHWAPKFFLWVLPLSIYCHKLSLSGSKFGNKNSFAKKSECSEENSLLQAKMILGFVKGFSEFVKGIYEICNHNSFNLVLIIVVVVFSIVQFILFLPFTSNN